MLFGQGCAAWLPGRALGRINGGLGMVNSFVQNEFCFAQFSGMASSTFQEDLENISNSQARPKVELAVDT